MSVESVSKYLIFASWHFLALFGWPVQSIAMSQCLCDTKWKFNEQFTKQNKWKLIRTMSTYYYKMFLAIWYDNHIFVNLISRILKGHVACYRLSLKNFWPLYQYIEFLSPLLDQSHCSIDIWGIIIWNKLQKLLPQPFSLQHSGIVNPIHTYISAHCFVLVIW